MTKFDSFSTISNSSSTWSSFIWEVSKGNLYAITTQKAEIPAKKMNGHYGSNSQTETKINGIITDEDLPIALNIPIPEVLKGVSYISFVIT